MVTIIDLIILVIYYIVLSLHFMLNSLLKFSRGNKKPCRLQGNEQSVSPHAGTFSSKHSIMADCPSPIHRACQQRGAPMCGQLRMGRGLVGVLGGGGWGMEDVP